MSGFTTMQTPLLDEINSRAGASDKDYEAWQAMRATGITATQVRDLYLGVVKTQDLIDLKLGRSVDNFRGNRYTAWGNKREPIIADRLLWAYGIEPESRVFRAADNPQFLASPDGLAVINGHLTLSEIKTANKPIPLGSYALKKKGYIAQMVWGMRVLGRTEEERRAARCLYAWEQHDDNWVDVGLPYQEPTSIIDGSDDWVAYDEELAAELEVIATEFIAELNRQTAGAPAPVDPADYEVLVATLLGAKEAEARATARVAELNAQILERIGDVPEFAVTTPAGRLTLVRPKPREVFDEAAWEKRAPSAHKAWLAAKARYTKTTQAKPSLRVTPPKTEGEAAA